MNPELFCTGFPSPSRVVVLLHQHHLLTVSSRHPVSHYDRELGQGAAMKPKIMVLNWAEEPTAHVIRRYSSWAAADQA